MKKFVLPLIAGAFIFLCLLIPGKTEAAQGGADKYIGSAMGITREQIINSLNTNAWKYLGTRFMSSSNWNNLIWPQGAPRADGYSGMNCAGWVTRAMMDAGANLSAISQYNNSGSMGVCGASTWGNYVLKTNTRYYTYENKAEMLADGKLKKGDIILTYPRVWFNGADTHLCIFWGDNPYDDKTWHQIAAGGNCITELRQGCANSQWFVFPIDGSNTPVNYPADYTGLAYDAGYNAWVYKNKGKIDTSFTGMAINNPNWYFVRNGFVDWNANTFAKVPGSDEQWLVNNGTINWRYKGLILWNNEWVYVQNGKIDRDFWGLVFHNNGWFFVKAGKIDWTYSNLVFYNNNWFYVHNGMIDWSANVLARVNGQGQLYKVTNGMVDWNYTGFWPHENTWYYLRNGQVDWNYYGLALGLDNRWYFVNGGYVDWHVTGLAIYNGNRIYVKNGVADFTFTGDFEQDGKVYHLVNGIGPNY